ncbi:hypothetical protein GCM10027277_01970 [Pseudoduganella ginsengisoli]|uniref:MSHA biogenesis protein MshK n=1 Tax=Pseudoduganella ginsengisoli TaxID=1462440 RepID=A0A6L6Q9E3_9BURK|nr:hypothetical protein [Pseudoduganella ginsengisoli]MTW05821.1 hypothetical protein [Pseudoduganella ginsengisoli]
MNALRNLVCQGQLVAVCALLPAHAAEPPPLGRLFTTPQQRAQLDAQRYGVPQTAPAAEVAPPPPPQPPVVVNGVVRPSRGNATIWLNQEPVPEGQRITRRDGKVVVTLSSGQRVTLKPGQRYDEAAGGVRDEAQ